MNRGRLALGTALFVLSLLPYALIPVVPFLGLPTGRMAAALGVIVVCAEGVGLLAVLVLGSEAILAIRRRLLQRKPWGSACER